MKYTEIKETEKTVHALVRLLKKYTDYDDLVKDLNECGGILNGYTVCISEFYDGDAKERGIDGSDGFDLDFGAMTFTIYRDNINNDFYVCENANYYIYCEKDDITDVEDIELGNDINEQIKGE